MGMSLAPIVLAAVIAIGVISLAMLVIGWRGRRVDDHPVCRRCRYDLIGLDPRPAHCPECSADLARPKAVRDGARRKRRGAVALGMLGLTVALVAAGALTWGAASSFNWNTIKPAWLLEQEMRGFGASFDQGVIDELASRVLKGRTDDERLGRLARIALDLQGDPTASWATGYGDIVEYAGSTGVLDQAAMDTYYGRCIGTQVLVRDTLRAGDDSNVTIDFGEMRLGGATYWFTVQERDCRLDGEPTLGVLGGGAIGMSGGGGGGRISSNALTLDEPGEHVLELAYAVEVRTAMGTPPLAVSERQQTIPLNVVAPDAPLYTLIEDESAREAMAEAVTISRAQVRTDADGGKSLSLAIRIQDAPLPSAYRVVMHWGDGHSLAVATATGAGGNGSSVMSSGHDLPDDFDASVADFEFVPSTDVLAQTLDIDSAWGGTIWIRGVGLPAAPE